MAKPIPRRQPSGRIFVAAALALLAVVGLCAAAVTSYATATGLADHTVQVRQELDEWLQILIDGETGARGYISSGEELFLDPYNAAMAREREQAALIRGLVATEGTPLLDVEEADRDAQAAMSHLTEQVGLVKSGRRSDAVKLLASGEGKRRMDVFRHALGAVRADEARLLAEFRGKAAASSRRALFGSLVLVLATCMLVAFAWNRERAHAAVLRVLGDESGHRLKMLSDLAGSLAEARTRAQVIQVVVEHGMRAAGGDTCTLYLLDEAGTALDLVADRGVAPEILEKIRRISESEGNPDVLRKMRAGISVWVESEVGYAKTYPGLATMPAEGPRAKAFWSIPLKAEGQALGLLGVGFYAPRSFPPEERSFVETLAGHCAQALLRASRLEREDEARRWLATTLRSIGDAVIATDAEGRVTLMNAVAEGLTGWAESDARGRQLDEVFPIFSEQTRALVESPVTKVLREGMIVGLANHTVLRSKRGVEIPIDDSGAPIRSDSGEIKGVVMVFRDVSREKRERVRSEFLAHAGETLVSSLDYQATLGTVARFAVPALADWCSVDLMEPGAKATVQVAVAHVDERKVRFARELGERYPPNPDEPTGVPNVIRTGRSELYVEIPQEMLEKGARDAEHLRIIRDLKLQSAMVVPLRVRNRTFGAITFVYAESGRRYSEDDLSFAEDFARRAAMAIENALALKETEAARMREQMLRSEAELANRAKDEFLATVSHELRTPLNAILGWTVLLRRRQPPEDFDRPLATIERNARLQTKLIEDVLDISRIISGKLVLNLGATTAADVIASAVDTVTPSAVANNIQIAVHVPDGLALVADPDRLQQVVWNLLSNAVKFTPKGGRIEVSAEKRGSDICVTVTDTGEGIRRSVLPFLFEPFRQADASTTRRHGGLGLGLAIVRQLVLAHGGSVNADSEGEGKGATFTVLLPERAIVPAFNAAGGASGFADSGETSDDTPRLDGLRLLVVDDERDALNLLTEALGEQGAEVHAVASAREALAALARAKPHVLVSDISMPDIDGLGLIKEVRNRTREEGGGTPAIALTAFTRAEDVKRALAAGYQLHLSKPVEIGPLARAVSRLARQQDSNGG